MASQDWVDKDFYATLGVAKDASEAEIKRVYRKQARTYHPDQNAGNEDAEKKFKDISEAYAVLSNPEDRRQYDAIRAMGTGARFTAGGEGTGAAGFEDLLGGLFQQEREGRGGYTYHSSPPDFSQFFGAQHPGSFSPRGQDRHAQTSISFSGAIRGTTIGLREANGDVIEVRIPAGVRDGQKVRVRSKGHPASGGSGDLFVTVNVSPHSFFQREGDDIRVRVPVTFAEAALGSEVSVPTVDGQSVRVRIPAGTPSGRIFRVKERGVATAKRRGDLFVVVEVVVPQHLSGDARAAVLAFAEATKDEQPRADLDDKARL